MAADEPENRRTTMFVTIGNELINLALVQTVRPNTEGDDLRVFVTFQQGKSPREFVGEQAEQLLDALPRQSHLVKGLELRSGGSCKVELAPESAAKLDALLERCDAILAREQTGEEDSEPTPDDDPKAEERNLPADA